jgi:ACS family glucarate transporter-like MFS transporter
MTEATQAGRQTVQWFGKAVRWRILALLFVISFASYLYRYNLSTSGMAVRDELGLSDTQLGMMLSVFAWGYMLFQFPGGIFGQLLGTRRAMTIMVSAWGAITLLCGMLPGTQAQTTALVAGELVLLRFLMGVVQAPLFPVVASNIASWFPVARWALPNGLTSVGATLGAAATPALIAWLVSDFGWRASFYLTALPTIALAALWWWYARDKPSQHRSVSKTELALIRAGRIPQPEHPPMAALLGRLMRNREVMLLACSYFCMNWVWYIFFSWLMVYLVDVRGFSIINAGLLAAAPWIAGSFGAGLGGEACDRLCKRLGPRWGCRIPAMAGLAGSAVLMTTGAFAADPYIAVLVLSLCYACNQFTEGAYWQASIFVGGNYTAAATGILNTGGNLAGVVATPMTAVLFEHFGWPVALATGSLFALMGAGLWLLVRADVPLLLEQPAA